MPERTSREIRPAYTSRKEIRFPWWKWLLIGLAAELYRAYMLVVRVTSKFDDADAQPIWAKLEAGENVIGAIWHQDVVISAFAYRGRDIVSMVSTSKDGEVIAYITRRLGYNIVRGSQAQRGRKALGEMIDYLASHRGVLAGLTVDGSRGPVYYVKPGVLRLSQETGVPVVPIRTWAKRHKLLRSWDRTMIPLPFNRLVVLTGEPVSLAKDATPEELEAARQLLETRMMELTEKAQGWFDPGGQGG